MCLFLIQHSLMAHMNIVFLLDKLNMACYARAIYVLCTCIVLQVSPHHNYILNRSIR